MITIIDTGVVTLVMVVLFIVAIIGGASGLFLVESKLGKGKFKNPFLTVGAVLSILSLAGAVVIVPLQLMLDAEYTHYRDQVEIAYGITLTPENLEALISARNVPVGEFFSNDPTSVYISETDETILVKAKRVTADKFSLYEIPTRGEVEELAHR